VFVFSSIKFYISNPILLKDQNLKMNTRMKGSEWRRWELHIHTPGTKKNDQFIGGTLDQNWEKYIQDINNYSQEIAAIAITDYLSIDNYFKFKKFVQEGKIQKSFSLIIPNIELRMMPVTGSGTLINIHCLFNSDLDDKIQERFLNKLVFHNGDREYTASLTDLVELGRNHQNKPDLPTESALIAGINLFVVSIDNLKQIFDNDPELKNNCLIVVSAKSSDGVSGLKEHCEIIEGAKFESMDAVRRAIYRFTDGLFSAMPKDRQYFLGEGADSVSEIIRKCFSLKPCYHGSDAHEFIKIFEPDLKRYCWLKADPTFNGLKQTLYEPGTRVRIQEEIPEQKKNYLVIDSVKFLGTGSWFSPDSIELNDKLNAIIGGKSSGKSLLLYYIAKAIDPRQVEKKLEELEITSGYDFDNQNGFDFQVTWKDGVTHSLLGDEAGKNRQITYIPQMYINHLAEKRGKDGLKKLIQSFLEEKESFKHFFTNTNDEKDTIKQNLTSSISDFFRLTEHQRALNEAIKAKGDKQARMKNLEEKRLELAALRAIAGFSEEDEKAFSRLDDEKSRLVGRSATLQLLFNIYQISYPNELRRIQKQAENSLDAFSNGNSNKFSIHARAGKGLANQISNDKREVTDLFKSLIERSLARAKHVEKLMTFVAERTKNCEDQLKPYLNKIQNRDKLAKLLDEIAQEQAVLDQIDELEREFARATTDRTAAFEKSLTIYEQLIEIYQRIVREINNNPQYSEISPEKNILLKAHIDFDGQRFNTSCTNFINKQSYFSSQFGNFFDGSNQYIFNESTHVSNFKEMFKRIQRPGEYGIRFNQAGTAEAISRGLLDDYFSVGFELTQGGEDILKMSPGKKGLILLFLILHLSNADYPILIDQPEDNLDNRTVYAELKDFIRTKKIERQVLIVTHNANLVVTTDAENIIVANQDGQDQGKENENFRFEYKSGALEDSFCNDKAKGVLAKMGIKEHVCDILEGGQAAFIEREKRYNFPEN
jgi:hypothetical protein